MCHPDIFSSWASWSERSTVSGLKFCCWPVTNSHSARSQACFNGEWAEARLGSSLTKPGCSVTWIYSKCGEKKACEACENHWPCSTGRVPEPLVWSISIRHNICYNTATGAHRAAQENIKQRQITQTERQVKSTKTNPEVSQDIKS